MKLAPEEVSPIYSIRLQQLLLVTQCQRVGRGVGVKWDWALVFLCHQSLNADDISFSCIISRSFVCYGDIYVKPMYVKFNQQTALTLYCC